MHRNYKAGYIPELDGLRGISIIGVMFFHAHVPYCGGTYIGVDIFFVLSGFLITRILIQEFEKTGFICFKNFYARRILRLGPALIVLLLLFCLVSYILLPRDKAISNFINASISLTYLTNWARAFSVHPPDYLSHTWSLSIEEQFYIIWPSVLAVLLKLSKRKSIIGLAAGLIALLSWVDRIILIKSGATIDRVYYGLDTRADGLMIGCALGIILASGFLTEKRTQIILKGLIYLAPFSVGGIIIIAVFSRMVNPWMYTYGFTFLELLTSILILDVVINPHSITGKILNTKWLVWVGSISYGLYLWHHPIFRVLQNLGCDYVLVLSLGSLLAFILAAVSYYVVELPILQFKRKFSTSAPFITTVNSGTERLSSRITKKDSGYNSR